MDVEITVTEDIRGWDRTPVPVADGVLRPAGKGFWVQEFPDGRYTVWRWLIVPGKPKP